jgi:hypothetical protein
MKKRADFPTPPCPPEKAPDLRLRVPYKIRHHLENVVLSHNPIDFGIRTGA